MSDFFISIGAKLNLSGVSISPSIRNTLAALQKSSSGTIKQKYQLDFDIGSVSKASDAASQLITDLQKTVSKTKIAPSVIMDQGELTDTLGKLELVPDAINAIRAVMRGIKAFPQIIPNAKDEFGKLALLKRQLKDLAAQAEKGVKIQLSPELEPIRKFDKEIIKASSDAEVLAKRLEQAKAQQINAQQQVPIRLAAEQSAVSKLRESITVAKAAGPAREQNLASARADAEKAKKELAQAKRELASSKPTADQINKAKGSATTAGALVQSTKKDYDEAAAYGKQIAENARLELERVKAIREQREAELLAKKQAAYLEKSATKKKLAPEISKVESAKIQVINADEMLKYMASERQVDLDKAAAEVAKKQKDYDLAAAAYDVANKGKKNIPARNAALQTQAAALDAAKAKEEALKADKEQITLLEKSLTAAQSVLASSKQALETKQKELVASAKLSLTEKEKAAAAKSAAAEQKSFADILEATNRKTAETKNLWEGAVKAERAAVAEVERLQKLQKGDTPARKTAEKQVAEKEAAYSAAEARVRYFEAAPIDEKLFAARKEERAAQKSLRIAEGKQPAPSLMKDVEKPINELKQALAIEKQVESEGQKRLANLDAEKEKLRAIVAEEQKALAAAKERAKQSLAATQTAAIASKEESLAKASATRQDLEKKFVDAQAKDQEALRKANEQLAEAQKAYNALKASLTAQGKGKTRQEKKQLQDQLFASPESRSVTAAESAVFSASRESRNATPIASQLIDAKKLEDIAKKELDAAKASASAYETSEAYTKAIASNLEKAQNAEENLRAIEQQRNAAGVKYEEDKSKAIARRTNAEKVLNQTLASRVDESKKDLEVEKNIGSAVKEITKVLIEAQATTGPTSGPAAATKIEAITAPFSGVPTIEQAQARLASATEKRKRLEEESAKAGGVEASRSAARKAQSERIQASQAVVGAEQDIQDAVKAVAEAQAKVTELQRQQAAAAAALEGNLQRDIELRKQVQSLVSKTVREEEKLNSRVGRALSLAGIEPSTRINPNAKETAIGRLESAGISQADIQKPTPELVTKIKEARVAIEKQRSDEINKILESITVEQRGRVITSRLEDLRRVEVKSQRNIIPQDLKSRGMPVPTQAELAKQAKEAGSVSYASVVKSVSKEVFGTEEIPDLNTVSLAKAQQLLARINEEIKRRKDISQQAAIEARELNKQLENQSAIEKKINEEIRKEAKFRANLKQEFAKQGVEFDVYSGQARQVTASGLGPARQVLPAVTSMRAAALNRLGVSEASISSPTNRSVESGRSLIASIDEASKNAGEERRAIAAQAKATAAKEQRTDQFIRQLNVVISRQIDLETRRAAATGTRARSAADIQRSVIEANVGRGTTTIQGARERISTASVAEETAATQRLTKATEQQNAQLRIQNNLEARRAQTARENAGQIRILESLIEQTTRALENQVRAVNNLARAGARNGIGQAVQPIRANQEQLRARARAIVLGNRSESNLENMSTEDLRALVQGSRERSRSNQASLRQFNDDVKAAAQGSKSGFEIIAKYGDSTFERLGGKIGYASEKLAAYAFGGAGLYGLISATRQAIIDTALLEKEITNIQQIFDVGIDKDREGDTLAASFERAAEAASKTKTAILDISNVTGQSAIGIAKAAKDLAAAGFGRGTPGFEETIRAVSFAELGPSFGNQEQIIDGLIASVNQFNQSLAETPYILGLVNEYSKAYAVEAQDLFEAVKRGGGAFASVGGGFEDFLKLVTITREQTREAAPVIGTFLKTVSGRLYTQKAEQLFTNLGINTREVLDPYERLVILAKKIKELNAGAEGTQLLSQIVDSRSVGRLAAILDAISDYQDDFADNAANISNRAIDSIARDARTRLDDIAPTIDRIRASYFRFIEGIYNNPATKAILRIPAGLGGVLSQIPELGVGQATVGNVLNPLAQGVVATGLVTVIRGAIRAFLENRRGVELNTQALQTLRTSVDNLRTSLATAAGGAAAGAVGGGGAVGAAALAAGAGGGVRRPLLSRLTGLNNPLAALGIATAIPAIVNSILPYTPISRDEGPLSQNVISSGVQGGATAGLIATVLSADPRVRVITTIGGALLSALAAYSEQRARDEEIAKLVQQSELSRRITQARGITESGVIPQRGFDFPVQSVAGGEVVKAIVSDIVKPLEGVVPRYTKLGMENERIDPRGRNVRLSEVSAYGPRELQKDLLKLEQDSTGAQKKAIKEQRDKAIGAVAEAKGLDIKEAQVSLANTGKELRDFINQTFLNNAKVISKDTAEARRKIIEQTAEAISKNITIEGLKLDKDLVKKFLEEQFLSVDKDTQRFREGLLSLGVTFRSLGESAETAGKVVEALGNALANSIRNQNVLIQKVVEDSKRVFSSFETTKTLLSTPFKAGQIQQISTAPNEANARAAEAAITRITGQAPVQTISPAISELSGVINGFFIEYQRSTADQQALLADKFSDDNLKKIGGINAELMAEETGGRSVSSFQTRKEFLDRVSADFGGLKDLGENSRRLFDIIQGGVEGQLPFDIRKLGEGLRSGDVNTAEKILGITEARNALIEQANVLIGLENDKIDQQLRASEALIAAYQERIKSEMTLNQLAADNAATINSYSTALGLLSQRQGAERTVAAQGAALRQNQQLVVPDITGFGDAISQLKNLQISIEQFKTRDFGVAPTAVQPKLTTQELTQRITTGGLVEPQGNMAYDLSKRIAQTQSQLKSIGYPSDLFGATDNQTRAKIASARQVLENEIQNFETVATQAFRTLGQEVDLISSKIQAQKSVLDTVLGKIFSGSAAESALAKANLSRASSNITNLVQEVITQVPNLTTMGPSEILANPQVAQIARARLSTMSQPDINAMRELVSTAGAATFTQTGASGEQVAEIIRAAFADEIAKLTGLNVSSGNIQTNVSAAGTAMDELKAQAKNIEQARIEMAKITKENAEIMSREVGSLTKAIEAIPRQIDIVISGIDNVNVGFDLTNVNESMKKVGDQVFNKIVERFKQVFQRNNIDLAGME